MNSRKISDSGTELVKEDFERLSHFRFQLRVFQRISEDICRKARITPLQYQLLLHILGFPGRSWATIGELAERLQARHNGVVALVSRCETLGLVERHVGREDRRQVEVHLTVKGEAIVHRLAGQHQPELTHLQQEFQLPGWTMQSTDQAAADIRSQPGPQASPDASEEK